MKKRFINHLSVGIACLLVSLTTCPFAKAATGHNNTTGFNGAVGCAKLDEMQSAGGQPEDRRILSLGTADVDDRTFEVSYDFYSIPDRMKIDYYKGSGPSRVKQTVTTGLVSGASVLRFTISAGSDPDVTITMNEGNGLSGTAWVYTPHETTPKAGILLSVSPDNNGCPDTEKWRNTLGGNRHAETTAGIQLEHPPKDAAPLANVYKKVFRFTVPPGTKCLRVSAVGATPNDSNQQNGQNPPSLIVSKHCPPDAAVLGSPAIDGAGLVNRNSKWRNTVVVDDPTKLTDGDTWYAVVFRKASVPNPTDGGILRVDCLQGGIWKNTTFVESNGDTSRIAMGIENRGDKALPAFGQRLLLLSHGRDDSPRGNMLLLGDALAEKWKPTIPYYINWSEGSCWNGPADLLQPINTLKTTLIGSRFISRAIEAIKTEVTGRKIDFFGHSWGTYIGNELAGMGPFDRFFALDPALAGPGYKGAIDFGKRANYSMAIYGNGLYGSSSLTQTANDSLLLDPPLLTLFDFGKRHSEPVLLMTNFVNQSEIGNKQVAFALDANGAILSSRPWLKARFFPGIDQIPVNPFKFSFQVSVKTNGDGKVLKFSYYEDVGGLFGIKRTDITQ